MSFFLHVLTPKGLRYLLYHHRDKPELMMRSGRRSRSVGCSTKEPIACARANATATKETSELWKESHHEQELVRSDADVRQGQHPWHQAAPGALRRVAPVVRRQRDDRAYGYPSPGWRRRSTATGCCSGQTESYAWVDAVHLPPEEWEDWQKIKRLRHPTVPDLILRGPWRLVRPSRRQADWQAVAQGRPQAVSWRRSRPTSTPPGGRRPAGCTTIRTYARSILDSLERTLKDYQTYRCQAWRRGCRTYPIAKVELKELILDKIVRYGSVAEVTKRERAAARKEARLALGFEEDRKNKKA